MANTRSIKDRSHLFPWIIAITLLSGCNLIPKIGSHMDSQHVVTANLDSTKQRLLLAFVRKGYSVSNNGDHVAVRSEVYVGPRRGLWIFSREWEEFLSLSLRFEELSGEAVDQTANSRVIVTEEWSIYQRQSPDFEWLKSDDSAQSRQPLRIMRSIIHQVLYTNENGNG